MNEAKMMLVSQIQGLLLAEEWTEPERRDVIHAVLESITRDTIEGFVISGITSSRLSNGLREGFLGVEGTKKDVSQMAHALYLNYYEQAVNTP